MQECLHFFHYPLTEERIFYLKVIGINDISRFLQFINGTINCTRLVFSCLNYDFFRYDFFRSPMQR